MTIPIERTYALINTKEFLYDLLDPKKTPRVPMAIRRRAAQCLKHYPGSFCIEQLQKKAPEIMGKFEPKEEK